MSTYIIYLDTKIKGALYQTIKYYTLGVFDSNMLLVFKSYPSIKKSFESILKKEKINYLSFRTYKEFPNIDNKIVFYLFNAQSNCRIVANRKAKHIFVTHGESNKISSVKPIIRIYDHVIVSGDLGIDRYLDSKLFYTDDIKRNKVIKMGDTFIGKSRFDYNKKSNSILYAPTWEGGIIEENYSSIERENKSFIMLDKYSKENNIKEIFIQPHPNTGHRDKRFHLYLIDGINFLLDKGYTITIVDFHINFFLKLKFKKNKSLFFSYKEKDLFNINKAFVDISAMEIQLMSKNIPTYIFMTETSNSIPYNLLLIEHYKSCAIYNYKYKKYEKIKEKVKKYCISYNPLILEENNFIKRIACLTKLITN